MIIVGDHGEQFGEFGKILHGNSVYRPVLHVPMIVRTPGQQPMRAADPISVTAVHSMLLRILDPQRAKAIQRRPVVSFYSKDGSAFSAVIGGQQLIRANDGSELVFGETIDAAIRAQARSLIARELAAQRGTGEFRSLGYLQ